MKRLERTLMSLAFGKRMKMENEMPAIIGTPERLAYWYLRLNGFLLWENFIIHPDEGRDQRTDADLLGVRFKNRAENIVRPMKDDPVASNCNSFCNIIIGEVKRGVCSLNGPWTNPPDKNIDRVLYALGCVGIEEIHNVARALYNFGLYESDLVTIRLFAFGDRKGEIQIQGVTQVLFNEMIDFIHGRFREYRNQKSSVGSWAEDGRTLERLANEISNKSRFRDQVRSVFGLPLIENLQK